MYNEILITQLKAGKVGIMPTDTVYGLVAAATNTAAVRRLYDLKSRESKPGTLIAATIDDLIDLGFNKDELEAVKHIWPNPVSIVLSCMNEVLHMGKGAVAVRMPDHLELQKLLRETGPLLTSSANLPGEPTAINIGEAKAYFGDSVDFYIDGGIIKNRVASTVVTVKNGVFTVLREGAWRPTTLD